MRRALRKQQRAVIREVKAAIKHDCATSYRMRADEAVYRLTVQEEKKRLHRHSMSCDDGHGHNRCEFA